MVLPRVRTGPSHVLWRQRSDLVSKISYLKVVRSEAGGKGRKVTRATSLPKSAVVLPRDCRRPGARSPEVRPRATWHRVCLPAHRGPEATTMPSHRRWRATACGSGSGWKHQRQMGSGSPGWSGGSAITVPLGDGHHERVQAWSGEAQAGHQDTVVSTRRGTCRATGVEASRSSPVALATRASPRLFRAMPPGAVRGSGGPVVGFQPPVDESVPGDHPGRGLGEVHQRGVLPKAILLGNW